MPVAVSADTAFGVGNFKVRATELASCAHKHTLSGGRRTLKTRSAEATRVVDGIRTKAHRSRMHDRNTVTARRTNRFKDHVRHASRPEKWRFRCPHATTTTTAKRQYLARREDRSTQLNGDQKQNQCTYKGG